MQIAKFFYKLYLIDHSQKPISFLGTAFSITPNGGLITCRHVVNISYDPQSAHIAVYDNELGRFVSISKFVFPLNQTSDLAFLPNALNRVKKEFVPILEPSRLTIGEEVYSFGYYAIGGRVEDVTQGYFSGRIINMFHNKVISEFPSLLLPYPVIEGMSGSPVMTYHNGPKLVGVCYGNQQQRIVASEIVEYQDDKKEYKETINRIAEFGLAYHPSGLISFLMEKSISDFIVSEQKVEIEGLEQ